MRLEQTAADAAVPKAQVTWGGVLEHVFPASVIDSMARGDVLQIVVFAFLFGAACAAIGPKAQPVVAFCESLAEVMFRYTKYVMYLAPLGVGAAIAVTVGCKGFGVLFGLGKLVLTMYAAQALFVVGVLGAVIAVTRVPLGRFYRAAREPFLLAFSTASSEAALPLALENMERFGVPKHIVGFVLPTGYSFNLDGSTLYLSLASVFVAQAAGMELSFGQQLLMMLTLMLTSKGVAGVPRASLVILAGTLGTFGLPMEGVAVLLGNRCGDGHGAHVRQRAGQLPGERRGGALGRRGPARRQGMNMRLGILLLIAAAALVAAEPEDARFKAGVQIGALDEREALAEKPLIAGGRFSVRALRFLDAEVEVNRFPIGGTAAEFPGTEFLFGAKAGYRGGPFGMGRPGFTV